MGPHSPLERFTNYVLTGEFQFMEPNYQIEGIVIVDVWQRTTTNLRFQAIYNLSIEISTGSEMRILNDGVEVSLGTPVGGMKSAAQSLVKRVYYFSQLSVAKNEEKSISLRDMLWDVMITECLKMATELEFMICDLRRRVACINHIQRTSVAQHCQL